MQTVFPVSGSEIVRSAELRKRKHESKAGGNFSRDFFCCVFPTI